MKLYRSSMEKIVDEMENATVITNPKERMRTYFRKLGFILSRLADRARRICRGRRSCDNKN